VAERGGARVVTVEKRQIAATRNAGARASSGDMLIFVDADTDGERPAGGRGGGGDSRGAPWAAARRCAFDRSPSGSRC
jgi:hypothetical protein